MKKMKKTIIPSGLHVLWAIVNEGVIAHTTANVASPMLIQHERDIGFSPIDVRTQMAGDVMPRHTVEIVTENWAFFQMLRQMGAKVSEVTP